MSSKREEERNEKIIRGLLKLPPNRRCINCNSLGPQYVCTSFWTFICTTCSGIHREFTHRVKSVSMAKFTSQEVDALQKGGNQRARELFLKGWDPQSNRHPDNSNIDKVREFIKSVYVDKIYSKEKSSDRPPRDPQSARSHEDEMRRASSYHSYSQSPPYDFQYEERQYGKHAPVLTRKPGSDRGLYEGKLASFLSPTHLSDDGFANEGSHPRVSDYSVSGGGTPFRSEVLSPVSQRGSGSPCNDTSRDASGEVHMSTPNLDAITRSGGRISHPQRTVSTESFVTVDNSSMSLKSINSPGLPEVGSGPKHSSQTALEKSLSLPSLPQSTSQTFDGLDFFSTPFSQNVNNTPQMPQPPPLDLFAALSQQQSPASFNENPSDGVAPNSGGWATFDVPQNLVPTGTEKAASPTVPSSDRNILGTFNPFMVDQSPHQSFTGHEPFVLTNAFEQGNLQNVDAAVNHTDLWNAFGNFTGEQVNPNFVESNEPVAVHSTSEADKTLGFGTHEAVSSDSNSRTTNETGPPPSSISSDFSIKPNDPPMVSAVAGVYSLASADLKPTNPFDMPFDSDMDSCNMSQVWDVSSLQGALPTAQMPPASSVGVNESWFPENSMPCFTPVPGGVPFDSATGSLGFIAGQAPYTQIPNIHGQGPVASVGGNPFA